MLPALENANCVFGTFCSAAKPLFFRNQSATVSEVSVLQGLGNKLSLAKETAPFSGARGVLREG